VGTRGLISDNYENNGQKQISTDQTSVHNLHDSHEYNENISNNKEAYNDIHNEISNDNIESRVSFRQKLIPKFPSSDLDSDSGCDLSNQEGADRFKAAVERLGKSRNKVEDAAAANLSGNGLLRNKDEDMTI